VTTCRRARANSSGHPGDITIVSLGIGALTSTR
jgi:hypothetical protein